MLHRVIDAHSQGRVVGPAGYGVESAESIANHRRSVYPAMMFNRGSTVPESLRRLRLPPSNPAVLGGKGTALWALLRHGRSLGRMQLSTKA